MRPSVQVDYYQSRRQQERLDAQLFIATLEGVKTPEQILLEKERLSRLEHFIDKLQPRTGLAVRLRYGIRSEPMTLDQVGEIFGVCKERVRQIVAKGERILRRRILKEENPRLLRKVEEREREEQRVRNPHYEWARKQEADQAQRDIEQKAREAAQAEHFRRLRLARDAAFERSIAPGAYERARDDFYRRQRLIAGVSDG